MAACRSHGAPERRATGDARDGGIAADGDAPRWTRTFSGGDDLATGVAATADGVVVVGNYYGELTTAGASAGAIGNSDLFVARLGRDGALRWLRGLGSDEADFAWAVAVTGDTTVVAGQSDGTIAFDGVRTRTSGQEELDDHPPIALAFDANGARAWWRGFATEDRGMLHAVAVAAGRIAVGGQTIGRDEERDLGAGTVACDLRGAFVAQLHADGEVAWARCSATKTRMGRHGIKHVAIGRDGAVAACGSLAEGQMSFGGDTIKHDADRGPVGGELFVASFAPDGAARWLISPTGQTHDSTCSGIAILDDGTVVVATNANGTLSGVELPEGAVVALDASGKPRWTASLPAVLGTSRAPVAALALDGARLWVAGSTRDEPADTARDEKPLRARHDKWQGIVVALDPASGAAAGAPQRLGDVEPYAVAVGTDTVYVAGRRPSGPDKNDAVVVALPLR